LKKRSGNTGSLAPMDQQRMGAAGSYPGIDPRMWYSMGIVQALDMSAENGPMADVLLLPSQQVVTARVGALYAGNGWGLYAGSLAVDDEVCVGLPSGELGESPVIQGRMWSPADKAPAQAVAHPDDFVLVLRPDTALRMIVTGSSGALRLGGVDSAEPLVLGTQLQNLLSNVLAALATHTHPTGVGPSGPPANAATFTTAKTAVDAGDLNSEIAFTQKEPDA